MRFGWTLASAWFGDSSQAKSVRPLFILQRRIPNLKLLAIPRMTVLLYFIVNRDRADSFPWNRFFCHSLTACALHSVVSFQEFFYLTYIGRMTPRSDACRG
jgi:hypothetical protein